MHRRADGTVAESFTIQLGFIRTANGLFDGTSAEYTLQVGHDDSGMAEKVLESLVCQGEWLAASFLDSKEEISGAALDLTRRSSAGLNELWLNTVIGLDPATKDLQDLVRYAHYYDVNSEVLREPDLSMKETRRDFLGEAGEHLGYVLGRLAREFPEVKEMIDDYISAMVPGARGVDQKRQGDYSEVAGRFAVEQPKTGEAAVKIFGRSSLSKGTLRLAGILAAVNQRGVQQELIKFMTIEEPEKALHAPKLGILFEALEAASHMTQVLVTTQSPDLLDNKEARPEHLVAVENIDGETVIGALSAVDRGLYEDGTLSMTDLLRHGISPPVEHPHESDQSTSEQA